ncbi:MAG TPA: ribokinase [Noviherbaspirillum sp.]|jgi:ribokinase|uniref:ribokinase n=1 Tax=Noviherbaspirillum sp. TaxID=1926288 RepID=UPI002F939CF0
MQETTGTRRQERAIFALGSINADFQVRVARRPEISETLMATDFMRLSGGKSANVAFLAARLGVPARLFGRVGDDDLARQALDPLREAGVDLAGVGTAAGASTAVSMIMVPPDGKKGIVLAANANLVWDQRATEAVEQAVRAAPAGSVLATNCEIPEQVVHVAMQAAKQAGITAILDPSPADAAGDTLIALAGIVVPNAGEASHLTGIDCKDPRAAAEAGRRLLARGAKAACVKLADGGCVLVSATLAVHVPAVTIAVTDTTGAGDAFAGALAVAILEQKALPDAVRFAVAASHLAVTRYGSQPAYPRRADIDALMQRLEARNDVR